MHRTRTLSRLAAFAALLVLAACATPSRSHTARLGAELEQAVQKGDWPTAIEVTRRLVELHPEAAGPYYNLACVYARAGQKEAAVEALRTSADRGFDLLATLTRDTDLDAIRGEPGFVEALAVVKENSERSLEAFKPKAERAVVLKFLPPNYKPSRPVPLIVALHGFGGDARGLAGVYQTVAAQAGAILILPQGLARAANGYGWGRMEQGEYLLFRAIEKTRAEHPIDRVVLTGFSQGASQIFMTALRHPDRFAGVIPVAGFYDHRVAPVPDTPAGPLPRFFIMNGALDPEATNNLHAAQRLGAAGAAVELRLYDGVGHAYPRDRDRELRAALDFVLKR